jgi:hypothetical protein
MLKAQMSGKKITVQQIRIYMQSKQSGKTQKIAAAQIGFSERSARNIEKRGFVESKPVHDWRTRPDPFASVWDSEILPLLERSPHLQARTILEKLQQDHEGYPDTLLRTLQRRVREWKATSGPEKEIIFRQNHPPGWQGMSDFTNANSLQVVLQGAPFEHLLYHYRLVYSAWEAVSVVLGGESFPALAEGLQNALWLSGGVPETHRTDSLSAAYKNRPDKEEEDFTADYTALCSHYRMEPTRNNKGVARENGAIESSHADLKNRIDQALMLRGSREFSSVDDYRQFIREIVAQHNRRIHKKYIEELACLKALPEHKTTDFTEERVRVTSSSTISVREIIYSVPSRLINMTLKVHVYDDRLECFVGSDSVAKLERKRRKQGREHQIDYRHVIGALCRKPQAFRNYIYREELFPTLAFRATWERLNRELDSRTACREYVKILKEAAEGDRESAVNQFLEEELHKDILPRAVHVQKLFRKQTEGHPKLAPIHQNLEDYDTLLSGGAQ